MEAVELVYVPEEGDVWHTSHTFQSGMTVADVLEISGIFKQHPEASRLPQGIFSKPVLADTVVKPGDRIELYRPLMGDPKEKRRARAKNT
ncbi:MAG: RnfH family protein [Legionellaceae bacterium]|nr:RnfH family protein [Legionellaceae bacterium]